MTDPTPPRFPSMATSLSRMVAVGCLAGLFGCVEQTDDLLGTAPLPAIDPSPTSNTWTGSSTPSLPSNQDDDPWSRADWTPVRIAVPMASTIHEPTYVAPALSDEGDTTAGRRTDPTAFPTSESALVVDTDQGEVILAGIAAPFVAVIDLVASPVRLILTPPWTRTEGPDGGWVLIPRIQTVESEGSS